MIGPPAPRGSCKTLQCLVRMLENYGHVLQLDGLVSMYHNVLCGVTDRDSLRRGVYLYME